MKYAQIGSISHGTLRTEDLLSTFAGELALHVKANFEHLTPKQIFDYGVQVGAAEAPINEYDESDYAGDLVGELQDALNEFAPPYCFFGSNEGDGSDFGYWPSLEAIEDLPRVADSDEAKALGEDCVFVNDHGNVTVYGGDGSVIWDCV